MPLLRLRVQSAVTSEAADRARRGAVRRERPASGAKEFVRSWRALAPTSDRRSLRSGHPRPALAVPALPARALAPGRPPLAASAGGTPAGGGRAAGDDPGAGRQPAERRAELRGADLERRAACRRRTAAPTRTRSRSTARCCSRAPGLSAGMVVVFPSRPGARISRTSPRLAPAPTSAGLLVDRAQQRALGPHHGAARPRSPHQLLRADLRSSSTPCTRRRRRYVAPDERRRASSGSAVRRPGHVDLVRRAAPTAATSPSIIAQAHAAGVTTLFIKSSDGSSNYWSQFSPQLVAELHAGGLKVVRLAVRLRHATPRARRSSAPGGRQRRRLPGDRRRGRVRRPLRRRADLHRRTAREGRPRLPARPGLLPLRLLPPLLPLLGVPRARAARSSTRRRCTGRTSASRSTRSTPTPTSPTASTAARSSRSGRPTAASRPPTCCASARRPSTTAPPAGPSGTGRRRPRTAGRRWPRRWRR